MQEVDLDGVMAVERAGYEFPWTVGVFRDCLRVGYCCWIVADEGVPLAHGIASVAAGESHILNICVSPEAQGLGVGRGLLTHLLAVAVRHGATCTFLEVRPSNLVAIGLYECLGFEHVGRRKNYYPEPLGREDALIMSIQADALKLGVPTRYPAIPSCGEDE
jgi:[ribosomal protein S18]-alanine N-acetyltransferase